MLQCFQTALNSEKIKTIINNCKQRIETGVIESSEEADLSLVKNEATRSISNKLKKSPKNGLTETASN